MSESPRAFREHNAFTRPPAPYKAPSMLAEHRGLAILFVVLCAAFAIYCLRLPRTARAPVVHHTVTSAVPAVLPTAPSAPASAAPASAAAAEAGQDVYVESLPSTRVGAPSSSKRH